MATAFDDKDMAVVDVWAGVVALHCQLCECTRDIKTRQRLGAILDVGAFRDHAGCQTLENLQLQPEGALGGTRDLRLELAQFGGGETHLSCEGLAVNEEAV